MPRQPRAEVCRECGQPRADHSPLALCEEHLRAYWRQKSSDKRKRRRGEEKTAKAPALPAPSKTPVEAAPAPQRDKPRIVVNGDRVTLPLALYRWMVGAIADNAPARAAPSAADFTRRLAVVSGDLEQVLTYEARPRELHRLAADDARYAQQMQALRESGFIICVEE